MDPAPYLASHVPHFVAFLAVAWLLDVVIAAIPDRILPAGSTAQAVVLVARAVLDAIVAAFRRPPGPPDRGVVGPATVMALLLIALPAHAGEPSDVVLNRAILAPAPIAADVVPSLAQQAALNACPEPCATCAAKVGVLVAPSWPTWAKVIVGIGTGIGGALTIYAQGHASGAW